MEDRDTQDQEQTQTQSTTSGPRRREGKHLRGLEGWLYMIFTPQPLTPGHPGTGYPRASGARGRLINYTNLLLLLAAKSLQSCPTLCDPRPHRWQPTRLFCPWDPPSKNTEWVAISFSNAGMHAKLLQSRHTLYNPMDSSPPGSSAHGILQAKYWSGLPFPSLKLTGHTTKIK